MTRWALVLTYGVLTFLLGVAMIAWPDKTVTVVALLLAVELLITGCMRLFIALAGSTMHGGARLVVALAGAVAWVPCGVAVAPTLGPVAPGRTRIASATIATPAARRPKTEPIDRLETRCRIPVVQADGSRDGISDTCATRRSGAGSRARSWRVARTSRWNLSSSFIG